MKVFKRDLTSSYFKEFFYGNRKSNTYVKDSDNLIYNKNNLKPIAFYLPQFYQTETNDKNWGEGYTEWTAVTRAIPSFYGHYQPHLPDSLGFYNLTLSEIFKKQTTMAKKYGVYGFCFYLYNFGDRKELRDPLECFCNIDGLNFPFCICWANENWTRGWDGNNTNILIKQRYDNMAMLNIAQDVCKYFLHKDYIKVNGKPLFIVYNPGGIQNLSEFAALIRKICFENGVGPIHLSYVNKNFDLMPQDFGFDSVTEFPPHNMPNLKHKDITKLLYHNYFNGEVFDIEDYVNNVTFEKKNYTIFRSAFPSWDNSARRIINPHVFYGSSPELFYKWLAKIKKYTIENNDYNDRLFFVNAWNEWGEGAHLEPDKKYGYAYLKAIRDILNG